MHPGVAAACAAAMLAGCSGNLVQTVEDAIPKREPEYKSSTSLPPLEVPPDLSAASLNDSMVIPSVTGEVGSATYSEYANAGANAPATVVASAGVLPAVPEARVERNGDKRWLVVNAPADQVWPRTRDFWLNQGFILEVEDPSIGIMETDWAEERESFNTGLFSKVMSSLSTALYGAATRDKFRTRLEHGATPGTTEVYVSHRGAEETRTITDQREGIAVREWKPRPADPELEAEMLNRLMVSFGVTEEQAATVMARADRDLPERARMVRSQDGASALALEEDFSRAWRRTGLALDRVGFTVEDRDRSRGLYFVRYVDPDRDLGQEKEGFLDKLKFWGDEEDPADNEFLISLNATEDQTQVLILNKEGDRENSPTADRILSLLHEQLK